MSTNDMVQLPREVLEKIQWCIGVKTLNQFCQICKADSQNGHKEDCPIGKALKVIPQHTMTIAGQKYITEIGMGKGKIGEREVPSCKGCCFLSRNCICKLTKEPFTSYCCAANNHDKLNRIWKKEQ